MIVQKHDLYNITTFTTNLQQQSILVVLENYEFDICSEFPNQ